MYLINKKINYKCSSQVPLPSRPRNLKIDLTQYKKTEAITTIFREPIFPQKLDRTLVTHTPTDQKLSWILVPPLYVTTVQKIYVTKLPERTSFGTYELQGIILQLTHFQHAHKDKITIGENSSRSLLFLQKFLVLFTVSLISKPKQTLHGLWVPEVDRVLHLLYLTSNLALTNIYKTYRINIQEVQIS